MSEDWITRHRGPTRTGVDGFREIELNDKEWGEILLFLPVPKPDSPWGQLLPLKDTHWSKVIRVVPGDVFSEALHGFATPLMRVIGRAPHDALKRLPLVDRTCDQHTKQTCLLGTDKCLPGSGEVPACYEAPLKDFDERRLASAVAKALDEGRYVVVVEGEEFSLARKRG